MTKDAAAYNDLHPFLSLPIVHFPVSLSSPVLFTFITATFVDKSIGLLSPLVLLKNIISYCAGTCESNPYHVGIAALLAESEGEYTPRNFPVSPHVGVPASVYVISLKVNVGY